MSTFEDTYLRIRSAAERHALAWLGVFAVLLMIAGSGLTRLDLDLSFRPLFASGAGIAAATDEFEQVFGQSSGAWVTVVLENRGLPTTEFIHALAKLSDAAGGVDGITDVLSLTSIQLPQWHDERLSFIRPIPEYLFEPDEEAELELQFEELLDGTRFVGWLVSAGGDKLILSGRLDRPLDDLDGRRASVRAFEARLRNAVPPGVALHFSGVSYVELAYERQVLRDQLLATALTSALLFILLYWTLGSLPLVLVCLAPVSLAVPATLGIMGWLGQSVTLINTAIPVVILVIGVADAVHMINAWLDARRSGADPSQAISEMHTITARACLFTTLTTMAGFAALTVARLDAVGSFGVSVAIGILVAWLANQCLLPVVLRRFASGTDLRVRPVNEIADSLVGDTIRYSIANARRVVAGGLVLTIICAMLIPHLRVDQKFNEEMPMTHPVTVSQKILEEEFGGFLGPEISVRRVDGGSMIDTVATRKLNRFVEAVRELPDTHHVWSVTDLLPARVESSEKAMLLAELRTSAVTAQLTKELINADNTRLAIILRIGDIGTARAAAYRDAINRLAAETWGEDYDVEVVGQWWLAQHGMRLLLSDMLLSFATALLIIAPFMWFALRNARLFIAAVFANALPLLVPLAFMALAGMTLRIGTAVVLALALGIVVDNTLHIILRLRAALEAHDDVSSALNRGLRGTGRAVLFTTIVLAGGFLSMLSNDLLAIRDMGIVAAITIVVAMLADLLLLPAVYAVCRQPQAKSPVPEVNSQ